VDKFAEGAGALAVDDADFAPAMGAALLEEGVHDVAGLGGTKRVKVERAFKRLRVGLGTRRAVGHGGNERGQEADVKSERSKIEWKEGDGQTVG